MRFARHELRTTDVTSAAAFYANVLGQPVDIVPLSPEAIARGAKPMWLGIIAAGEAAAQSADSFVRHGGQRLGPPNASGVTIVRDPGGAVVAFAAEASGVCRPAWHHLVCHSPSTVARVYAEVCGWSLRGEEPLGALGSQIRFAFDSTSDVQGGVSDVNGRPGLHPHWTWFFGVPDVHDAVRSVRASGGLALDPVQLPGGKWVAACDDPQGAAFGLINAQ